MAVPLRDDAPTRRTPWVTSGLILVNIVVFLFVQPVFFQTQGDREQVTSRDVTDARSAETFLYRWGAVPCEIEHQKPLAELAGSSGCEGGLPDDATVLPRHKSVFLALLTSMFLHGGISHLAGNMLFLWVFGNNVEDRLGPLPYLAFYLFGGVVATLGHVVFNLGGAAPVVGASGAIAALMGAYLVFKPHGRILTVVITAAFQVVYIPAFVVLGLFFVTQFLTPSESQVAWEAHAAGMAAGAVVAVVLARVFADPDAPADRAAPGLAAGTTF